MSSQLGVLGTVAATRQKTCAEDPSTAPSISRPKEVAVAVETSIRRQVERVAPEVAVAKLDLRDICLLAAFELLTDSERQTHGSDYRRALALAQKIVGQQGTALDRPLPEIGRLFFSFTWVFPNLGLAGPFFAGETRPLKDAVLLAAREAIVSGVSARHHFHARLWDQICEPGRRVEAAQFYVQHKPLHSFPPSAGPEAIERYCRRVDALIATAECMPALLATWAIERNPDRLRDLSRSDVKDKHGLFEQRHMAPFLGMTPNTLSQSLKRLRLRFGEEMRLLWEIEKTDENDGEQEQ
jgi:hypothetical protein